MAKRAPRTPTPTAAQISDAQRRSAARHPRPAIPSKATGGPIKVRATRLGYYDHKRRREGDVFTIASATAFSDSWMERVNPRTPERITTGREDLRRKQGEISATRHGEGLEDGADTGVAGEDNPINAE